jgi:hypothetical protein
MRLIGEKNSTEQKALLQYESNRTSLVRTGPTRTDGRSYIFTAFSLHFHCIDHVSLEVSLDVEASLSLEVSDITLPRAVSFYVHVEI